MSCEDQGFSLISDGCLLCIERWEDGKPVHPQFIKQRSPSNAQMKNGGPLYWVCPICHGYYGEVRGD
jgi:hypothetical protein